MQKVLSLEHASKGALEWRVARRSLTLLQMSVSSASLGQRLRICPICFVSLGWRLRTCCICCCVAGRRLWSLKVDWLFPRRLRTWSSVLLSQSWRLRAWYLLLPLPSRARGSEGRWSAAVLSWILNGCWSAIVSPLQAGDSEQDLLVSLPFRDSDSEQCPLTSFPLLHSDSERRCFC